MTLERLRRYATVLAVTLWTVWLVVSTGSGPRDRLGKVKGTDFIQFYAAGSFVRDGRADRLYDMSALHSRAQAVSGGVRDTLYPPLHAPQVAYAFAPFAAFPYSIAVALWTAVILVLYAVSCWMLWTRSPALHRYPRETLACSAAFPGLYSTVLHGQLSAPALVLVTLALIALSHGRKVAAGIALGCLVFKPHWALAAAAVFLVAREWRVVVALALAALVQTAVSYVWAGPSVFAAYIDMLKTAARLGGVLDVHPATTLGGLAGTIVPMRPLAQVVYAATAVATLLVTSRVWRRSARFEFRASAVVLAMVLISPHAFDYDLILLAPVFFLLLNAYDAWGDRPRGGLLRWMLVVLFLAPLVPPLPPVIRLQFSVTAMAATLWLVARFARERVNGLAPRTASSRQAVGP